MTRESYSVQSSLSKLSKETLAEIAAELQRRITRSVARNKIDTFFPDAGPLRRELYKKHLEFFAAGVEHRERLLMAANRVGKTEGAGGYEIASHLMGEYPSWWQGKKFAKPIRAWMAGKTNETTRDILQKKLLGEVEYVGSRKVFSGTGLIRGDTIGDIQWKSGVSDLADSVKIKSKFGHGHGNFWSILGLKSYQQGRGSFEGTEQDIVWLDEEPPLDVYIECLIRTMTTNGLIMLTFTPLEGMSDVVLQFLPGGKLPTDA